MTSIYRIMTAEDHAILLRDGRFAGSPLDRADGFIHMSTADQVAGTLAAHFAGVEGLVLLRMNVAAIESEIRWEPSRGGQLFPHLYRDLTLADISASTPIPLGPQAVHQPMLD